MKDYGTPEPSRGHHRPGNGYIVRGSLIVALCCSIWVTFNSHQQVGGVGVWVPAGMRALDQAAPAAAQLQDGAVLVAGNSKRIVEVYDAGAWAWRRLADLYRARRRHSLTALHDGGAIAVGGMDSPSEPFTGDPLAYGAERFDRKANRWLPAGEGLLFPQRSHHVAALLPNGSILIAGGCELGSLFECDAPLFSAQIYDPEANRWTDTGPLNQARYLASGVVLDDGRVLVVGGVSRPGKTANVGRRGRSRSQVRASTLSGAHRGS